MMSATGKRPNSIVSQKSVEQAGAFLADLPEKPKENLSLREAVTQLQDQIKAALAKGYSYDDVAGILRDRGIDISASTLKNYVPAGRRAAKERSASKLTKRHSKTAEEPGDASS